MRRAAGWIATLALLALAPHAALAIASGRAAAAEPVLPPGHPSGVPTQATDAVADISPGPATVRGRVVHDHGTANVGGLPVVLYAISPDGPPGLRETVTDADGAFRFASIGNDPATIYLLGTRYAEIPFGLRFSFTSGEIDRQVEIAVADATSDTSAAAIGEVRIGVDENCTHLVVHETHRLDNPSDQTLYVPVAERSGRTPILRVVLPEGASGLETRIGDELEEDAGAVSFWGPLRPGQEELEFSYELPKLGPSFELPRSFPLGARRLVLVNRPGGPTLTRGGSEDAAIGPGDTLTLRVDVPAADEASKRISVFESRVWLDFDGAALSVDAEHTLRVAGDTPVVSTSGAPLFCVPLPSGAEDLRFSSETLEMGISRDPSGALAVRGPLQAGESTLMLRFLLPVDRNDPEFTQLMPFDVPLLSILVADTGLVVETTRMHRRRPVRTSDRSYLHLEAFQVAAGEPVELHLRPLQARTMLPRPVAAGITLAVAAIAIGFMIAPLRHTGTEVSEPSSAASRAAEQRESVLMAIRGLDEDFEIGKLTEADHREMRQELRAEAVALLRIERAALADDGPNEAVAEAAVPAAPAACPRCKAPISVDGARFCSQCGARLDAPAGSDGAARV